MLVFLLVLVLLLCMCVGFSACACFASAVFCRNTVAAFSQAITSLSLPAPSSLLNLTLSLPYLCSREIEKKSPFSNIFSETETEILGVLLS